MCGYSRDTHRLGAERGRGGMMTPLLQYVARFDGRGAKLLGLEWEVTRRVGRGAPCLSDSRLYLLLQTASI